MYTKKAVWLTTRPTSREDPQGPGGGFSDLLREGGELWLNSPSIDEVSLSEFGGETEILGAHSSFEKLKIVEPWRTLAHHLP
ncbi:spermine oxidase isoform X2 [Lates japonicus]|uniref:Spermine oxidase isoform X2 n=1 Tax=Lates japonicus TaxID=270547 RepID=A0AAD3RL97_LATJO|nr:spermine oxidase isoform X2 [Lates japonicus]